MRLALAYHSISPTWSHDLAVSPRRFRAQMHLLRSRGFAGVRLSDLGAPGPRHRVSVTFDDGFRTVVEYAKPVLDELEWPATVFLVTDAADTAAPITWIAPAADESDRRSVSWDDARRLAEAGWEVGSHSCTHRLLSSLADEELAAELRRSREAVASHVGTCTAISYPWGEVDSRVVAAARSAGYTAGSGLAGRFTSDDPLRIPRFAIGRSDRVLRFALKTSRPVGAFRASPGWIVVDRVRRHGRPLGV
ncbi:MAG TPA: polysaccharide deacetylase family protein [Gaiellaceae bacterium]